MIKPMLCKKYDTAFDSEDYFFEAKFDGDRCIAEYKNAILDGEVVVLGPDGMPDFNRIQQRSNLKDPLKIERRAKLFPATYMVFDILSMDGENIEHLPLHLRKEILTEMLKILKGAPTLYSRSGNDMTHMYPDIQERITETKYIKERGKALFEIMEKVAGEGIIAKPVNSIYQRGNRGVWKKIKIWHEGVFVVCGVTAGKNGRTGKLGALVLGKLEEGKWVYHGEAGSGLTDADVEMLPKILNATSVCPFDPVPKVEDLVSWINPELELDIQYAKVSVTGKLIFPSIRKIGR